MQSLPVPKEVGTEDHRQNQFYYERFTQRKVVPNIKTDPWCLTNGKWDSIIKMLSYDREEIIKSERSYWWSAEKSK